MESGNSADLKMKWKWKRFSGAGLTHTCVKNLFKLDELGLVPILLQLLSSK